MDPSALYILPYPLGLLFYY